MDVEKALSNVEKFRPYVLIESKILATEVKRLREELEKRMSFPIFTVQTFDGSTPYDRVLYEKDDEIRCLREDANGRDEVIELLQDKIQVFERKVKLMSENRQNIGTDLKTIWNRYF